MYHSKKLVSALLIVSTALNLCAGASLYPKSLQTQKGSVSSVPLSALQKQDQSGNQDSWDKYVEFYGSNGYQGVFTFDASAVDASSVGGYTLDVNFKGPKNSAQSWEFELYNSADGSWIAAGDNTDAQSWKWTSLSFCGTTDFASLVSNGKIQLRLTSGNGDDCDLDYLAITTTDGTGPQPTTTPTEQPTSAPTTKPTAAPTTKPTTTPTTRPTSAPTSRPTKAPTTKPTAAPTTRPTAAPTTKPTAAPTTKPTAAPTTKPTSSPTTKPPGGRICPAGQVWSPAPGTTWQWQLTGSLDLSYDVQMYDIDLFDQSADTIAQLHAKGIAVVCYFSTQYENWRPDANKFTSNVLGSNLDDWPGERYVDIRSSVVRSIMTDRLDLAVSKGCDGVEPDNVDEYANSNGLGITAADQLSFNKFVASEARKRGLSVGLKNDLDQVSALQSSYDWALNEQCAQYGECNALTPFTKAGKAVFGVEYSGSVSSFCPSMMTNKFSWLLKDLSLSAKVTQCCTNYGGCTKAAHTCVNYNAKREIEAEAEEALVEEEAIVEEVVATPAEVANEQEFDSAASTLPIAAVAFVAAIALVM